MKPIVRHLYVHTPFCAKICPYCAFYVEVAGVSAQDRFVAAAEKETAFLRDRFDWQLETIYFGGGTPSLLTPSAFARITHLLPSVKEFTLEANPATVTPAKAAAWRAAGVNRISLGAQSFDADYLKLLGRQHQPEDIAETCAELRAAGFSNLNLDLMYALPHQPMELWQQTVEAALTCRPDHLSCYGLTFEEDTPFFERLQQGEWKIDETREREMFLWTRQRLRKAGLPPYEVSNFACPGFESAHNQGYWHGADYLGIGPSASSVVGSERWKNKPSHLDYATAWENGEWSRQDVETNPPGLREQEQLLFSLRTREGVPREMLSRFTSETERLVAEGLAVWRENALVLTDEGCVVADSIAELFALG
jgi:oxygen-independent coproporphyrinogen-3 oxidase